MDKNWKRDNSYSPKKGYDEDNSPSKMSKFGKTDTYKKTDVI